MRNFTLLAATVSVIGLTSPPAFSATSGTVAFLMPDQASTRYEQHDFPGFKSAMAKLCPGCHVVYQNANADASLQQQQFNSVIAQGAKVVVLDPVDSAAAASLVQIAHGQGVKVIAYDRPIPKMPADFYVSFDNKGIGRMIAQSLVADLKAHDASTSKGGVLEVNGSPTDAAAGLIRDGIHEGLASSGYKTLAEYDTPDWAPPKAQEWASGQVTRFGDKIVGVVAANDGTAGGVIAAFKAAGVNPVPPVTGNDATIAGLQLIIAGDQYNTISKPSETVAAAAAKVAVALLDGQKPAASTTLFDTPTELFTPALVTAKNIKSVIFDTHLQTPAQVCTGDYAAPCHALGI
ncbi:sugar ABC transporter substrate-binding protein (plasmid) [Lichenicola cladoniae]|uniref:Sugar ABC transporter substrate-binding protein n=1 Tax=Lichenicola cladoniae TaxID=1484109 RepID=A0A6M8HZN3_9PROT|nr:sugar ABC transporter substrate-binding protein [Lichenicola cladoniae]QKE93798.1 sugar ABC transporter substrate-binding protein [Lichenicola cladoniae]QKE93939.1 sugar ABC transporter substrate-binding protein [Lichenicola cladoniae]